MTSAALGTVGPERAREDHRVHQQADAPQAAADEGKHREALDLIGDDVVGQPRVGRVARAG